MPEKESEGAFFPSSAYLFPALVTRRYFAGAQSRRPVLLMDEF